jgi:hypothetical protein
MQNGRRENKSKIGLTGRKNELIWEPIKKLGKAVDRRENL